MKMTTSHKQRKETKTNQLLELRQHRVALCALHHAIDIGRQTKHGGCVIRRQRINHFEVIGMIRAIGQSYTQTHTHTHTHTHTQ